LQGALDAGAQGGSRVARRRRPDGITSRQQQVLTLVARGQTNKEIAHELAITERGVAAHISRLLRTYNAPNRAGLVATTLSASYAREALHRQPSRPNAQGLGLPAFDDSRFLVTVTFGRDQVISYQNRATRKILVGLNSASMMNRPARDRFTHETAAQIQQQADDAFTRKATVIVDHAPIHWQKDDGTWSGAVLDLVLQPLFGSRDTIAGILWIGTAVAIEAGANGDQPASLSYRPNGDRAR
jgi:DNA-binding CsgD family transcriptional regulator